MRDSDTGLDWTVAVGISVILCTAAIGAGLLGDVIARLVLGA